MRIVTSLCIYEWRAWDGFLLPMMFPEATRVPARLGETSTDLLKRLPPHAAWFAFHINLTATRRTPLRRAAFCRALRARGVRILNEHVTDISKHHLQDVCVQTGLPSTRASRAGDPAEWLIVKTNANYAGEKEKFVSPDERRALGLGPRCRWISRHDEYLIRQRRDVPPGFWRSRQVIVERFIENRSHAYYRAYKLLDRVVIARVVNPAPIKKMLDNIPRANWYLRLPSLQPIAGPKPWPLHVAGAVLRVSAAFGLDFGTIDLVEDDAGQCYVIDVNTSPYMGTTTHGRMLEFLAAGVARRS